MSEAAQQAPVAAPAPDPSRRHEAVPAPSTVVARPRTGLFGGGTTPDRFRRWSIVAAGSCVVAAIFASISVGAYANATSAIEDNTGPVVVNTQTLLGSLAEADAAATAAFLSGADEDPTARRAHLDARERATDQLEDISALIGDDPAAHEALKDVAETLTVYVGQIEAARATRIAGLDEVGEDYLIAAVTTLSEDLTAGAARLSAASEERLSADSATLGRRALVASVVLVAAFAVLALLHVRLSRATRRILNLPLAAGTLVVGITAVWSVAALASSQQAFDDARGQAFEAIRLTADVQAAAFASNDAETVALITGVAASDADEVAVRRVIDATDSEREDARAREAVLRWDRYREARQRLRAAAATGAPVIESFAAMTKEFNGFSFTMEAVLADNTDQFFAGLDAANDRTRGLPVAVLVGPLLAGLLALAGFQLRINEYR